MKILSWILWDRSCSTEPLPEIAAPCGAQRVPKSAARRLSGSAPKCGRRAAACLALASQRSPSRGESRSKPLQAAACLALALVFSVGCATSRGGTSGVPGPAAVGPACCVDGCQPLPACGCPDDYRSKCEPCDPCNAVGCRPDDYCAKPLPCDPCPAKCGGCDDYLPKCDALAPWRPAPGYVCAPADPCPPACAAIR